MLASPFHHLQLIRVQVRHCLFGMFCLEALLYSGFSKIHFTVYIFQMNRRSASKVAKYDIVFGHIGLSVCVSVHNIKTILIRNRCNLVTFCFVLNLISSMIYNKT